MNRPTISLLATLCALPVLAQDVGDLTEEPEIRRYSVEIIVFTYAQDVASGNEVFLPDEPVEPASEGDLLVIEEPEPAEEPEPLPDIEFVLFDDEDYRMQEIFERLQRLDAYDPVMHFGWTQAAWPEEQTEAIPLHRFARPPAGLDGSLTLFLSRFLHLVVDLQLEAPRAAGNRADGSAAFGNYAPLRDDGLFEEPAAVYYRIQEDRKVRNGELRYYDHPKFGVLAQVNRVEEEEEDPETGELLGYPLE